MSVRPISYANGVFDVVTDECGHTGQIPEADIVRTTAPDGTENHSHVILKCPQCDTTSTHPVGGGAAPVDVQGMFTILAQVRGCPCGQLTTGQRATAKGTAGHVEGHCAELDGPERWQLDDALVARLAEQLGLKE